MSTTADEHPTGKPPENRLRIENRFWEKVDYGDCDPDECWEWTASTTSNGYGRFKIDGAQNISSPAHRVAYALANDEVPGDVDAEVIRHQCHNTTCCNPAHLKAGTQAENVRDSAEDGRMADTPERVIREIRERYEDEDVSQSTLADDYDLSQPFVSRVVRGERCKYVE